MPLRPFYNFRPDIAWDECRCAILKDESSESTLPPGKYAFTEWYCDEPDCDCQRVMFVVVKEEMPGKLLAHITLGFDRTSPAAGPYLDPLLPQSRYAPELLELFKEMLLPD